MVVGHSNVRPRASRFALPTRLFARRLYLEPACGLPLSLQEPSMFRHVAILDTTCCHQPVLEKLRNAAHCRAGEHDTSQERCRSVEAERSDGRHIVL